MEGLEKVKISHPERVVFPEAGVTKGMLVDYYRRIAPRMLPYLAGRPLTLQRFPGGLAEEGFFQQQAPDYFPAFVHRATVAKADGEVTHAVCDNAATLVYLANQGVITPHVWLSRVEDLHRPDRIVFDLDPSADDFGAVVWAARQVRAILDELGLPAFVMTTGSRGLHVVTPLVPQDDFEAVRAFARGVADVLARRHPEALTVAPRKEARGGRLFLDVLRNTYAHTAVPPYAVRALPEAPVATPLGWHELGRKGLHARRYTVRNLFRRLARGVDPWAGFEEAAAVLGPARRRLEARAG